ncbi:MAG: hypothetical protein ACR2HQ_11900 [Ilumatobacteraceae bacterium]
MAGTSSCSTDPGFDGDAPPGSLCATELGVQPAAAYHRIDPAWFGRPDAEVTDVLDLRHVLEVREAAIAAHRSQTSPFTGLSAELRQAFLAHDHLARVAVSRP